MGAKRLKGCGKRALCLLLIVSLPILPGCWDRKELNEIAIIRGIGIDRTEDGQIEVTLLQAIPQRSEQAGGIPGRRQQRVLSDQGISISEAKAKLQEELGREIFVGHQEVVVLGRRMAETGIREALDYISKHPAVRKDALLFVSSGSPMEIFEVNPMTDITSSGILYKMSKVEGYFEMTAMHVLRELAGESGSTIIPLVRKRGEQLTLDGAALFRGDRMVAHLDRETKEALMWIRNEYSTGTVDTRIKGKQGLLSMRLTQTKVQLVPEVKGNKPRMIVNMTAEGIVANNTTSVNTTFPSNLEQVTRAIEREIRNRLQHAVKKLQKSRADAAGFGEAFHHKRPKDWAELEKNWNDRVFPRLEVVYRVQVNLRSPGMRDYMGEISG